MGEKNNMDYGKEIRLLHSLLAFCMVIQLAIGELMEVPGAEEEHDVASTLIMPAFAHTAHAGQVVAESWMFEIHQFLGLAIAALLLIRLSLAFSNISNANWHVLTPWRTSEGRQQLQEAIKAQILSLKKATLPPIEENNSLAKTVHGLILLIALAVALTGTILFFGWNEHGHQTMLVDNLGEVHETLIDILLGLLGIHILATIMHQRLGHQILERIKPFQ